MQGYSRINVSVLNSARIIRALGWVFVAIACIVNPVSALAQMLVPSQGSLREWSYKLGFSSYAHSTGIHSVLILQVPLIMPFYK